MIKAYKGFNKDMSCNPDVNNPFQYEEGKEYECEKADVCSVGFHACEMPLDVFNYYYPANSVYHEVEQDGDISRKGDDSKVASTKIKIGAKLSIANLIKAQFEYVKAHTTYEFTDENAATAGSYGAATAGYRGAATAGDSGAATAGSYGAATAGSYGAATAGDSGAATAGSYGAATAGDSGAATAGSYGAATAGDSGAATAGDSGAATAGSYGAATAGSYGAATAGDSGAATAGSYGAATAGYRGAATAGSYGAATAGYSGAATSRGAVSVGKDGIASVRGNKVKAKGGIGSIILIAEENDTSYGIKDWKVIQIDGEKYKPDVWYMLVDGEIVEADDE